MATTPAFIATARVAAVSLSSANTATDGTGTITTLIAGASTGTRILEIDVKQSATSAAAIVNIFLSTDGGTTWKVFDSITVSAVSQSNTVAGSRAFTSYANLILPSSQYVLGVTTTIAQATNVIALGGDL